MNKRIKYLCVGLIIILIVVAAVAIYDMSLRDGEIKELYDVREMAEQLYAEGDIEKAIYQMEVYCTYVSTDIEARALLGDWYKETNDTEKAYECYYTAALNKELSEERIPALSVKNTEEIILEPIGEVVLEITPDVRETKDMYLMITGHNLVPEEIYEGRINGKERELSDEAGYYTTDWFSIDPEGEYLTMSGGFNYAIWQFRNAEGEITHAALSTNTYREKDTYAVDVYQMARAVIPEGSAWCRVTFYDKGREEVTAANDEELTIVYGRLPGESRESAYITYDIPDLKEGESIVYTKGEWKHIKNGKATVLEDWGVPAIERGSYLIIGGTLPGRVSFDKSRYAEFDKSGIYSIKFDINNPSAMGERCDDAKNLGFNAAVSEGTIALGENHFDSIYPWKDMRLCNIADGKVTFYEGEEGFYANGENGDVFVEIPKFYVRRVVDGEHETISISGVCHEGFTVDEAFIKQNGEEADAIYVAAYITSIDEEGNAVSVAQSAPVLSLTPAQLAIAAEKRGYKEIDYHVLSALQRLFMVETGLRNSQYLYLGTCGYTTVSGNADYAVAMEDNVRTNCVVVDSSFPFVTGNSVIVFDKQNYEGTIEKAREDVRKVTTVIENSNGTQSVYISGEPMDVYEGRTAVVHTALENGTTRNISGHTGAISTDRGTVAFKYRNIENFWGNAYIYIDAVKVKGRNVTIEKRNGEKINLGYMLPDTKSSIAVGNMVRSLGYDSNNPLVMLPDRIGDGATTSTYYGDEYTPSLTEKESVLHYGGGWSSRAGAGMFSFAATSKADETHTNASGRMMYIN